MSAVAYPQPEAVAASFSSSAASYDAAAILQCAVGDKLLAMSQPQGVCLDLGCGTGRYTKILSDLPTVSHCYALDIAEGMLQKTQQRVPQAQCLHADARAIPLPDNSVDFIYSSLMLQWLGPNSAVFTELKRVLKPSGSLVISSLLEGTLCELSEAWATVDNLAHVNRFETLAAWQQVLMNTGFELQNLQHSPYVRQFDTVRDALLELKALGAHNVNPLRPKAMTGKRKFAAFSQAYEAFRRNGKIPASYQVLYGVVRG